MSSATMPLMALYNYDNTIFDGLTFPAGIDKDTAIDEIIIRSGEFEILYPDPNFIKPMITHWGKKHYRTFEKWIDALNIDFEPLYNYDRYEEYTDEKVAQGNTKANTNMVDNTNESISTDNNTSTSSNDILNTLSKDKANSASQTSTDSSTTETDTRNVSAYDSATYQPREQEVKSTESGQTGSGSAQNESESEGLNVHNTESNNSENGNTNRTGNTASSSEQNTASTNTEQNKHTAHLYGNIGVTTSTQMLEDYIRVERFCIYEQIADIFVDEFCIMIY